MPSPRSFFVAAACGLGLVAAGAPAHAQPAEAPAAPGGANSDDKAADADSAEAAPDNDAGLPEDLRAGHFLLYAGGGFAFIPDALAPVLEPAADIDLAPSDVGLGGGARLLLGVGLNRFLVLGLNADFGRAGLSGDSCESCSLTTIGTGLGLSYHPSQAFAFDPWVRYAVGYRFTSSSFDPIDLGDGTSADTASESAFEFAKLSIGGDFYPDPVFGFGPYLALDLGLNRLADSPQVYANVQLGLRLAFDPMRGGVTVGSNIASR